MMQERREFLALEAYLSLELSYSVLKGLYGRAVIKEVFP